MENLISVDSGITGQSNVTIAHTKAELEGRIFSLKKLQNRTLCIPRACSLFCSIWIYIKLHFLLVLTFHLDSNSAISKVPKYIPRISVSSHILCKFSLTFSVFDAPSTFLFKNLKTCLKGCFF